MPVTLPNVPGMYHFFTEVLEGHKNRNLEWEVRTDATYSKRIKIREKWLLISSLYSLSSLSL